MIQKVPEFIHLKENTVNRAIIYSMSFESWVDIEISSKMLKEI